MAIGCPWGHRHHGARSSLFRSLSGELLGEMELKEKEDVSRGTVGPTPEVQGMPCGRHLGPQRRPPTLPRLQGPGGVACVIIQAALLLLLLTTLDRFIPQKEL